MPAKLKLVDSGAGDPPRPLQAAGMALWRSIVDEFDVSDSAARQLLCLAAESLDAAAEIQALIEHAGAGTVSETGHVKANPLNRDLLACRAFASKCIERLGLLAEPVKANGRPGTWSHAKAKQSA